MFKKTLLASIMASSFAANAAVTLTQTENTTTNVSFDSSSTNAQLVSLQGLPSSKRFDIAKATNGSTSGDLTINIDGGATEIATLSNTDNVVKVKVELTGGFFSATPTTSNVVVAAGDTVGDGNGTDEAAVLTAAIASGATSSSFTINLTKGAFDNTGEGSNGDNSWTEVFANGDLVKLINLPIIFDQKAIGETVSLKASILSSTNVSVGASQAVPVAKLTNQFAVTTATSGTLSKKIDVANERKTFESKSTTDALTLKFTTTGTGATATEGTLKVKGDFTGIKSIKEGSNTLVINDAKTEASFEYTGSTTPTITALLADASVPVTLTLDGTTTQTARNFTYDFNLEFNDSESASQSSDLQKGASAGGWSLNGKNAAIELMPFGPAYAQSVTVTNKGSVEGEITVDWTYNGETFTTPLTTKAAPKAITELGSELAQIAAEKGVMGNARLYIVVNSPDGDVKISALYYAKADKDRGIVAVGL